MRPLMKHIKIRISVAVPSDEKRCLRIRTHNLSRVPKARFSQQRHRLTFLLSAAQQYSASRLVALNLPRSSISVAGANQSERLKFGKANSCDIRPAYQEHSSRPNRHTQPMGLRRCNASGTVRRDKASLSLLWLGLGVRLGLC